ncbi:BTB/POZ and TAZ domain-containing protein 3 [Selaginella moellendorffii]|nr:BTB/POZ and TAZ domain-containing protein 3 [Selaginella moellendorffii]|eukprot:XP_002975208.2 BTB/POZ and TAZ domain-containing protein 3 [Selaginella moellendorffii]
MALTIHQQVNEERTSFRAMKPPLYRPPLQRSISSQDSNASSNKPGLVDNHSLIHRSASLDTAGILHSRTSSQEISLNSTPQDSSSSSGSINSSPFHDSSELTSSTTSSSAPPPPPLPSWNVRRAKLSASSSSSRASTGGVLVPREIVDNWDKLFCEGLHTDVCIVTEDGGMTAAHSFVLAASSPVFLRLLQEQQPSGKHHRRSIHILGVPYDAARVFTRFVYSSRYEEKEMEKYVLHLLALSHSYSIPLLKKKCTEALERGLLTTENVVDVLQLARLCDASRLNLLCLRLIVASFKTVVKSEGWRVMRESDQTLEQELVGHVIEADARKQEKLRKSEEDKVYKQLHDAMEALVHICRDGCRTIGPHERPPDGINRQSSFSSSSSSSSSCGFPACKGLESLVRHFAGCRTKVSGGCLHCKRMWELLELHSRMCGDAERCKVPLCRHFKDRIGQQTKKEESRWNLLVAKVKAAKGASTAFSLAAVSATLEKEAYRQ